MRAPDVPTARAPPDCIAAARSKREPLNAGAAPETTPAKIAASTATTEEADVDANLVEAREIRGRERGHGGGQRDADGDAERAAEERDDEAFGEELTHQAAASRAERGAHRQLAAARAAAREEQIREVRARNQQHQRDTRRQHHQRRPHSHRHLFHERLHAHFDRTALAEDQLRRGRSTRAGQRRAFGFGLRDRHAWREAGDRVR